MARIHHCRGEALLSVMLLFTVPQLDRQTSSDGTTREITVLVKTFTHAQESFDQPMLAALTADDYIEVSPKGTKYGRSRMLHFYGRDRRAATSIPMTVDVTDVRVFRGVAVAIAQIDYVLKGAPITLVGTFVARATRQKWLLVSVQYTQFRQPDGG